ncbi:MAG TPA: hypothetical protein PL048_12540, partial [Leptospiraceae bacterium]|nr:hypothetical protein [Leptospiraceae bacterium]HMY66932.1 hypothetical protein [Leptospiraceae bacterium]HMZ59601.1 hypothetical protein [Leptospiraceae bacterium]HNN05968.1 hypothetical protein [Leptospiraceae bacterium]
TANSEQRTANSEQRTANRNFLNTVKRNHLLKYILPLVFITVPISCCIEEKNEFLGDIVKPTSNSPTTIRIGFDQIGDLYPDDFEIEKESFLAHNTVFLAYAQRNRNPKISQQTIASKIIKEFKKSGSNEFIILIHGYNVFEGATVNERQTYFDLIKYKIREKYPKKKFFFLEVYWDGMMGKTEWAPAQMNSFHAGRGLGELLRKIDPEINNPLTVITHSRGASVASYALWNVPLRKIDDIKDCEPVCFRFLKKCYPVPIEFYNEQIQNRNALKSVRIGYLAPAIGGITYFEYFPKYVKNYSQVVIGINEKDSALRKKLPYFNVGTTTFGDSSFGVRKDLFCKEAKKLQNKSTEQSFVGVDFLGDEKTKKENQEIKIKEDSHTFQDYVNRKQFTETFLPLLFEKTPPNPLNNVIKCGTQEDK